MGTLDGSAAPLQPVDNAHTNSSPRGALRNLITSRNRLFLSFLTFFAFVLLYLGLFLWRRDERAEIVSLTNLQRLASGTLLYAQDWDGKPPPVALRLPTGETRFWKDTLRGFIEPRHLINPGNPVFEENANGEVKPSDCSPSASGFAMNKRFQDTFGSGTYPLDNLELPSQTALFVGAGKAWKDPLNPDSQKSLEYTLTYRDVSEKTGGGLFLYPSSMRRKLPVAAADGHAELVEVENYNPSPTRPHDKLYGRIGGGIYNWNGGYPSGETDRPPRE